MCRFTLEETKKNAELRELLQLEPVSLVINRDVVLGTCTCTCT